MEYHLPSNFNQYGVNMASPLVQNGGVGYQPTPPSFKYNGELPIQTMQPNLYDPYNNQQYYSQMGQYASQQLQQPVYNQYNGYTNYNNSLYNQNYIDQTKSQVYDEAYKSGQMTLSEYCYYNNGGIQFTGADGNQINLNQGNDWYSSATQLMQRQQEAQQQYQKEYNIQMENWKLLCSINNKFLGIEEEEAVDLEQKILYQQKWEAYRYEKAVEEYQQDCLVNFIKSLPNSTQKGYMSPIKEQLVNNWNKFYHQVNDKYPENYGLEEYFNQGILMNQMIDDMEDDAKRREKQLDRLYDKQQFRDYMHQLHPEYDPVTGTSIGARRLGIDDIEVSLPPHLAQQDYVQKRQKFLDTIFRDNRLNIQT